MDNMRTRRQMGGGGRGCGACGACHCACPCGHDGGPGDGSCGRDDGDGGRIIVNVRRSESYVPVNS